MNCKVITYENPKQLNKLSSFNSYTDALHICATKNMRDGVYECYQKNSLYIKAPIISSIEIIEGLIGQWYGAETKLKQYLHLSEILRNEMKTEPLFSDSFAASFRRNQTEVLDTIRLLELSGIKPFNFEIDELMLTEKEKIFISIWSKFENNEYIQKIRKITEHGLRSTLENNWKQIIGKIVDRNYKNDSISEHLNLNIGYETIVLHGFYFMTPEQQQIFTLLKDAGTNIVFLNLYNENYPETFSFIERFINEKHGWIDKESWDIEKNNDTKKTIGDKFLMDFEGKQLQKHDKQDDLKIVAFDDFYEFLEDYEGNLENNKEKSALNKTYLAPNAASLNDRLQEYYPELFKEKRHFLAFPIGQYLYHLHQMWNEDHNSLVLTEKGLFESFASGWVYDQKTGENAYEYTKILDSVLPFFKGCVTQKSWKDRLENLIMIKDTVVAPFERQDDDKFQQLMASPFSFFSQFSVSKNDIDQISRFMKTIFDTASNLFEHNNQLISLSDHFSELRKLLDSSSHYLREQISVEEQILIDQLKETLNSVPEGIDDFHVNDISTAISLYLSGHLKKDHEEQELIRAFIEIDGEAFKQNEITHVTGLDENSLPYSEFKLPWPLTSNFFEYLANRSTPLSFETLRNKSVKQITRYLFYNLLQFSEKLELSWMVQLDDKKNLDKAIYLSQLDLKPMNKNDDYEFIFENTEVKRQVNQKEFDKLLAYPIDALAEFIFCPRRFYYSYLSGGTETFKSEFVQEFLFGNLLKTVGALSCNDYEKIKKETFKLFPQWNKLKLNMIAESNMETSYIKSLEKQYDNYVEYGTDYKFTDFRKIFLFPAIYQNKIDQTAKKVYDNIKKLYKSPATEIICLREEFENQLQNHPVQMESQPSYNCRYCPHNSVCVDAYNPIDDAERRRNR